MTIEKRALQFDNLLVYEKTQLRTDWQEGFFMMEDLLLTEGIYKTGPVFFSVAPTEGEESFGHFTYYLPINEAVRLENEPDFQFKGTIQFAVVGSLAFGAAVTWGFNYMYENNIVGLQDGLDTVGRKLDNIIESTGSLVKDAGEAISNGLNAINPMNWGW